MQKALLLDVKKRNNREVVELKMEKTFAHRRHEVVRDVPMVEDFMARWPALFEVCEINAEFKRITTVPLQPKFLSQLDHYSDNLTRMFQKRGGQLGARLKTIIAQMADCDDVDESVSLRESVSTWVKIQRTLCGNMWAWMKTPSRRPLKTPLLGFMFLKNMLQVMNLRTLELSLKASRCCKIWIM
ncbi:uncharacterized protein LOC119498484 isoform X2 [Sebastes umbrosus]|uniref:uncharacterized protein LOC119498484 isoform X2 n=1 Tax=Sebastes umbrosus TaxID=72105 RepID=UPI00189E169C|nr:uncharacterized protein LOC119498484 isoform X2 [Sebastes umbrosus]